MNREQLEHAIRAACDVTGDTEIFLFGSQSVLGQFPNAPLALRFSMEVDADPKNLRDRVDEIDGSLGEGSSFHQTHGFYVHGVSIESATLAHGWDQRCIEVCNANTRQRVGYCLEVHDLALSKLAAFRPKDREFLRTLLKEDLVQSKRLLQLCRQLDLSAQRLDELEDWILVTVQELAESR